MLELKIKLKSEDGERTYTQDFLVYDELTLNCQDETELAPYIEEAKKKFGEHPDDVRITIKMML
tara:strand:- start:765 stop:956 length:192 start_codon:yes stop_codon:yes gene_type:complete